MGTPLQPQVDPVSRDLAGWVVDQLDLDPTQLRAAGPQTFATLFPGHRMELPGGGFIENEHDDHVLIVWVGMAHLPTVEYMTKREELKLQHEGGRHRAER